MLLKKKQGTGIRIEVIISYLNNKKKLYKLQHYVNTIALT